MKLSKVIFLSLGLTIFSGCADWIYRIDIPQGNYLAQDDVDKLRIGMTKEQVIFVLGRPVVQDAFDHDTWYYVYKMKRGMKKRGDDFKKDLVIEFQNDKVTEVKGDFELAEDFNTPIDS